ncbi:MAG: 4Fe-4S binding protein, partial [Clostridia bacterium]|nr:4Fe-4S binding protein [Clostridia bacterium]
MAYRISNCCKGCGKCRERCSAGAIVFIGEGEAARCRIDPDLCVSCGHCAHFCENGAILDGEGRVALPLPPS